MNTPEQQKFQKRVRMEDFICQRCHSEATNTADHLCQLCKAIGKSAEPPEFELNFHEFFGLDRAKSQANRIPI